MNGITLCLCCPRILVCEILALVLKIVKGTVEGNLLGLYGSFGKEIMAMGVVESYLQIKKYFCQQKKTGKMARAQGKCREDTGNLVLIGASQPCFFQLMVNFKAVSTFPFILILIILF